MMKKILLVVIFLVNPTLSHSNQSQPEWLNKTGWVSFYQICEFKKTYIPEERNADCNKPTRVTGSSRFSNWAGEITHMFFDKGKGSFSTPKIKVTWITGKAKYRCGQIIQKRKSDLRSFEHRSLAMKQC